MNPRAELHPDLLAFLQRGLSLYMAAPMRAAVLRPCTGPYRSKRVGISVFISGPLVVGRRGNGRPRRGGLLKRP